MSNPFKGVGTVERYAMRQYWDGSDYRRITNSAPWAVTNVNATLGCTFIGGKPMISMAGAGAGTDGHQHQWGDAGHMFSAGKQFGFYTEFRSADIANHEFWFGSAAIDTAIIASAPTDFLGLRKLTGATRFSLVARKASGTEEVLTIGKMPTLSNSTNYAFEVVVTPQSTATQSRVQVWFSDGLSAGGQMDMVFDGFIAAQTPDTVDSSMACAWRAGTAVTTVGYFGNLHWWSAA